MLKNEIARRKEAGEVLRVVAGKYGGNHSTIANVISGRCSPPPALLEGWSKLFDTPAERARFIRLGHLAHATPEVLAIVAELEARVAKLSEELAALRAGRTPVATTTKATPDEVYAALGRLKRRHQHHESVRSQTKDDATRQEERTGTGSTSKRGEH